MAHREFRDSTGRLWAAWSVQPEYAERRAAGTAAAVSGEPPAIERRGRKELRVPLGTNFSHGWLCFETKGEKRRLAPYPDTWSKMSDEELEELCGTAAKVEHGPRRLVE
jgi:hypothetical protein